MSVDLTTLARFRRMVVEPESTTTTYTDEVLTERIEAHAVIDSNGYEPDDTEWTPTYDLNAAAADIWEEKAAVLVGRMDFAADGGQFSASQQFEQAKKLAQFYRSKQRPVSITLKPDRPFWSQDMVRRGHTEEAY